MCLCDEDRGPTTARYIKNYASKHKVSVDVASSGFYQFQTNRLPQEPLRRILESDRLFVMEPYMADRLKQLGIEGEKISVLNIPDIFDSTDHEDLAKLTKLLDSKVKPELDIAFESVLVRK